MASYVIQDTTLTGIADAIREKNAGKTITNEIIVGTDTSAAPGATGFDSYSGYGNNVSRTDTVTIPGATKIKVKIAYQSENTSYDYVTITPGVGEATAKLGNKTLTTEEFEFPGTDTVSFYFKSDSSNSSYLGYYAEITGIQEETIDLGAAEYFPTEMAEAIKALEGGGAVSIPEIEWHYVTGDSTFLSELKTNVTNLDDLVCLIAGPGVSTSGYPFIYTKGNNSYDGDILYCSVYMNSKWNGYAAGEVSTFINLSTAEVKRAGAAASYGTYFQRYLYGVQKASTPGGGDEPSTGGETPATFEIVSFITQPRSGTASDTFPVPEEHRATLTSKEQLISVEGYYYDSTDYYTYSYIPQRVLQFKSSKRLERCPNGVWDTNINASTSLTLSSDGVIGTSDRTSWGVDYPITVTYMLNK